MMILTAALAVLLVVMIVTDLRLMRIPDVLTIGFVILFAAHAAVIGPGIWLVWQIGLAVAVFVLGFIAFGFNLMGGGDTKVLPALVLFVPISHLSAAMLVFAASLLISILTLLIVRRVWARPDHDWAAFRETALPMGLPIGITGLVLLTLANSV